MCGREMRLLWAGAGATIGIIMLMSASCFSGEDAVAQVQNQDGHVCDCIRGRLAIHVGTLACSGVQPLYAQRR